MVSVVSGLYFYFCGEVMSNEKGLSSPDRRFELPRR